MVCHRPESFRRHLWQVELNSSFGVCHSPDGLERFAKGHELDSDLSVCHRPDGLEVESKTICNRVVEFAIAQMV